MNNDTFDEAITALVKADHPEAIVTGFAGMVAFKRPGDFDEITYYAPFRRPRQSSHETEGLAHRLVRSVIDDEIVEGGE
jgi:hypothetical protein